jgi:hypothetical protein
MSRRDTSVFTALAALTTLAACAEYDRFMLGSCEISQTLCYELHGVMSRAELQLERDRCTRTWRDETACHIVDVEYGCRRDITGDEGDFTVTTWFGPSVVPPWQDPPTEADFRMRCVDRGQEYVPAPVE